MKRRVYGEELASEPSQFLNEMPLELMEDLSRGNSWLSFARGSTRLITNMANIGEVRRLVRATIKAAIAKRKRNTQAKLTTASTQSPNSSNNARRNWATPAAAFTRRVQSPTVRRVPSPKSKVRNVRTRNSKLETRNSAFGGRLRSRLLRAATPSMAAVSSCAAKASAIR